jgi:hypothetical protein
MKVAVLADDDGKILAIGVCRMSPTGQVGTFTEHIDIRAEMSRTSINALRGRPDSTDYRTTGDDLIESVMLELPEEHIYKSLDELMETMMLDQRDSGPFLRSRDAEEFPSSESPS